MHDQESNFYYSSDTFNFKLILKTWIKRAFRRRHAFYERKIPEGGLFLGLHQSNYLRKISTNLGDFDSRHCASQWTGIFCDKQSRQTGQFQYGFKLTIIKAQQLIALSLYDS